jgi:hypothetical protein
MFPSRCSAAGEALEGGDHRYQLEGGGPEGRTREGGERPRRGAHRGSGITGRTLVVIPDETLPYTALTVTWNGGDSLLPQDRQGLAALAGRALTKGTAHVRPGDPGLPGGPGRPAGRLFRAGTVHAFGQVSDPLQQGHRPLIGRMIAEPAFLPEEVARARTEQVAEHPRAGGSAPGAGLPQRLPLPVQGSPLRLLPPRHGRGVTGLHPGAAPLLLGGAAEHALGPLPVRPGRRAGHGRTARRCSPFEPASRNPGTARPPGPGSGAWS